MNLRILLAPLLVGLLGAVEELAVPVVLLPDGGTASDELIVADGVAPSLDAHLADDAGAGRIVHEPATADPPTPVPAAGAMPATIPELVVGLAPGAGLPGTSNAIKILLLLTVLAVAPGFLMMVTSFTRIIIVLGFLRRAIGTQTLPPNQVLLGLALFMTLFVMAPTLKDINDKALQPYMAGALPEAQALDLALVEVRGFMAQQTRKSDLALFLRIAGEERPTSIDDVGFLTLVPAFITSELKTAFQMGFIIFLPFLVIDLVVAAVLMALGMMMLPPVMVSMPFKILLFVLVDGWVLLVQSLVASYGGSG